MAIISNLYQGYQPLRANNMNNENKAEVSNISNNNGYKQYHQSLVNTATPQELTLMLYNGLVKFLKLAYQGMEEKNVEKVSNNIIRAQDIITEFISTLDFKYEVSNGLMLLYDYMNRSLLDANIKKDKEIIEEVIGYAEELRDTWSQAMKLARQQMAVNK